MANEPIYKYELLRIEFEEFPNQTAFVHEDGPFIEYDADGIPMGWSRPEIKVREKIIKDFYVKWIAEHPNKAILNKDLNKLIYVKYQSINETSNQFRLGL